MRGELTDGSERLVQHARVLDLWDGSLPWAFPALQPHAPIDVRWPQPQTTSPLRAQRRDDQEPVGIDDSTDEDVPMPEPNDDPV